MGSSSFLALDGATVAALEQEFLGEGTFGRVTLAYWHGSPIVIKVSKSVDTSSTFLEEVPMLRLLNGAGGAPQVLAVLSSPLSIVTTFRGRHTLWDYMESKSLPDHALRVALALAERLREVHALGIIHNDLKSDNVMLETSKSADDDDPRVNIIDYGLACISGQTIGLDVSSEYRHIAPEVRRGGNSTEESDVYSLGMLLCRMTDAVRDPRVRLILNRIAEAATKKRRTKRITLENIVRHLREATGQIGGHAACPSAPGKGTRLSSPLPSAVAQEPEPPASAPPYTDLTTPPLNTSQDPSPLPITERRRTKRKRPSWGEGDHTYSKKGNARRRRNR